MAFLFLAACGGGPAIAVDGQPCDDAGICPEGQMCEPDGICRRQPATDWVSFADGVSYPVELSGPGVVAAGDADGDGLADLVFSYGPHVSMWPGDGTGAFGSRMDWSITPRDTVDLAIADIDDDGQSELLVGIRREFDAAVLIYRGGDVTAPDTLTSTRQIDDIATADVDGDGEVDVLMHHAESIEIDFGGGARADVPLPGAGDGVGIVVADLDGDGLNDIVCAGPPGLLYRLRQTTARAFAVDTIEALNPITSGLFAGDFDDDGAVDLGVVGPDRFRILGTNTQADTFGDLRAPVVAADVNGDGLTDVTTLSTTGPSVWLRDPARPSTFLNAPRLDGLAGSLAIADVNGDGRPDIIAASNDDVVVYLQR